MPLHQDRVLPGLTAFKAGSDAAESGGEVMTRSVSPRGVAGGAQPVKINLTPPGKKVVPIRNQPPTVKVEEVRLVRPDLGKLISGVSALPVGVPRNKITSPVSPTPDPTDQVLFEEPANSAKKYYLPRYRISEQTVSGQQRYQVSLQQSEQGWAFSVQLEKFPAPELGEQTRSAAELSHAVSVILTYRLEGSGVQKEVVFQEVTQVPGGFRCVSRGSSIAERDQLYQAITRPQSNSTLIVRRVAVVAVPTTRPSFNVEAETKQLMVQISNLQLQIRQIQAQAVQMDAQVRQLLAQAAKLEDQITHLPPFFGGAAKAKIKAQIDNLRLSANKMQAQKDAINKQVPIKQQQIATSQARLNEIRVPLFREVTRALDSTVTPFVFPPDLHGYIYRGVTPTSGQTFGLVRWPLKWKEKSYSYYQDQAQPNLFYYLPDSFKLVRRPESPHGPIMSVRFASADGSVNEMKVTLEYVAGPFVDPDRLQEAARQMKKELGAALASDAEALDFQPLLANKVRFLLALPRADATSGLHQERTGALVDLRSGIHDALTLSMTDFQTVYDAMFGGSAIMFAGQVTVELGEGQGGEQIPFEARLDDLLGEIFDYQESPDPASGGVRVTLRNAIESPVKINRLGAELRRGNNQVAGKIEGLDFASPIELAHAGEITFLVVPSAPLPGQEPLDALFDLDGVEVLPDKEAVWGTILNPDTPAEYVQAIQVKSFKEMFDPPQDRPEDQIMAIVVHFERGDSVDLTADKPVGEAKLRLSISDYVLRRSTQGEYRYRTSIIRKQGGASEGEWKTNNGTILWVTL